MPDGYPTFFFAGKSALGKKNPAMYHGAAYSTYDFLMFMKSQGAPVQHLLSGIKYAPSSLNLF